MNYDKILSISTINKEESKMETITSLQDIKDYKYIYTLNELTDLYNELRAEDIKYDATLQFLSYLKHLEG